MKISVIMPDEDARRFNAYCKAKGYKKSTLIVRLIREHLDKEQFGLQQEIFDKNLHSKMS